MSNNLDADYRELRSQNLPARAALAWARERSNGCALQWETDDRATTTVEGFGVVARVERDDFPDLSYLGEWTDSYGPDVVEVPRDMRYAPSAFAVDWRYFEPAITASEHRDALTRAGFARHTADCLARSYVRRDMRAMTETETYVVFVTVSRAGVELGSASVGGVDFLPDTSTVDRETYVDDLAGDLIAEAIEEARANLAALCV